MIRTLNIYTKPISHGLCYGTPSHGLAKGLDSDWNYWSALNCNFSFYLVSEAPLGYKANNFNLKKNFETVIHY